MPSPNQNEKHKAEIRRLNAELEKSLAQEQVSTQRAHELQQELESLRKEHQATVLNFLQLANTISNLNGPVVVNLSTALAKVTALIPVQ